MNTRRISSLLLILGVLLTLIPLTGCSNDDDGPVHAAFIIGKWQGVKSSGWEKEDGKVVDKWNDNESFDYDFIEFKYDATGEWSYADGSYSEKFAWHINDDYELVIGEEYVGDGTGDEYRIKTETKDKLVLISGDDDPEDGWYQEDTYKRID